MSINKCGEFVRDEPMDEGTKKYYEEKARLESSQSGQAYVSKPESFKNRKELLGDCSNMVLATKESLNITGEHLNEIAKNGPGVFTEKESKELDEISKKLGEIVEISKRIGRILNKKDI